MEDIDDLYKALQPTARVKLADASPLPSDRLDRLALIVTKLQEVGYKPNIDNFLEHKIVLVWYLDLCRNIEADLQKEVQKCRISEVSIEKEVAMYKERLQKCIEKQAKLESLIELVQKIADLESLTVHA